MNCDTETKIPAGSAPPEARIGLDWLALADPALGRIEALAGPLVWRCRAVGFAGLMQAIVGQQISNQAAAAIWRRLALTPGALDAAGFLALDDAALRPVGLSRPKLAHGRALAAAFVEGRLDPVLLAGLDDAAAIAAICAVRGLGPWTAEVYLLFAHERPDIFPAGDLALAASLHSLKGLPGRPSPAALRLLAEPWRPWRSLAARLLWHHWRHVTGRPAMDDLTAGEAAPPVAAVDGSGVDGSGVDGSGVDGSGVDGAGANVSSAAAPEQNVIQVARDR